MKKILFLLALLFPIAAHAQTGAFDGFCDQGGVSAVTSGLNSTNKLQGVIPYCNITVYLTGTKIKATIYKDAINTPQTNPYQTLANGQILFFAATGVSYDVVMSGGIPPNTYATPVTLTGVITGGGTLGGGCTSSTVGGLGNITCTGTGTFGSVVAGTVNSVVDACQQSGTDGGAKVNTALAKLGGPGTITIDLSCGTTWTTPVVATSPGQFLQFLGGAFNLPSISLPFANDTIDGSNSTTLQMQAYSGASSTPLIQLYSGSNVGSNASLQNITIDGNTANTPTAESCLTAACRPGLGIDNGGNSSAVHDIHVQNVTFQNFNGNPIAIGGPQGPGYSVPLHFPFPYNIYVDGSKFINNGVSNIYSTGWDHNLSITNNYFTGWGTGLTSSHANTITTIDLTNYPGTSQFDMKVTGNTFANSVIQPDGFNFAGELGAGGMGWITNFTWEGNHMLDGGTGDGPCLSGVFQNGAITGNDSTSWGFCEITGSNIAITGNTLQNGVISLNPGNGMYSTGNTVTGNTISVNNGNGPYTNSPAETAITIAGGGLKTINLTQAIKQTAQTFNVSNDGLVFTPQTSSGTPPLVTITGTFSGGASNGFKNWAFLLSGAGGATQGAHNLGNNGTFICYSSTGTTISFVNPNGVSETLPTGAQLVSSASTTAYVGTFFNLGTQLFYGGFNGWVGQPDIPVSGFANAGNNASAAAAMATAWGASGNILTITVPNQFAALQSVTIVAPNSSDSLYPLNGNTYSVLSVGLNTSQIEVNMSGGVVIAGSGSTAAQIQGLGFTAIANSTTVLAVTNANGANETAATTMNLAPIMANSVVSSNDVSLLEPPGVSGNFAGMLVGYSDNTHGVFRNLRVENNIISGAGTGIWIIPATPPMVPSWGLDVKDNTVSDTYLSVRVSQTNAYDLNDLSIEGNYLPNTNQYNAIYFDGAAPLVYRTWDNVITPEQNLEILNGGTTVDNTGTVSVAKDLDVSGHSYFHNTAQFFAVPGNITSEFLASDNLGYHQNVQFAAPYPKIFPPPTGAPSTAGGTIPASITNFAYLTCTVPYGELPGYISSFVTTTGSTSSIVWSYTAPAECSAYGTPVIHVWPEQSGTPTHYFTTSSTSTYTQTSPASSGTPGTMASSPDYLTAILLNNGGLAIPYWQPVKAGLYNAATNPIGNCDSSSVNARKTVSDATSGTGVYAGGGSNNIPVVCTLIGGTYAWMSQVGGSSSGSLSVNGLPVSSPNLQDSSSVTYSVSGSNIQATASGSGGVSSFAAPSGSWPSWLVPTVTNASSTPSLAVSASTPGLINALQAATGDVLRTSTTDVYPYGVAIDSIGNVLVADHNSGGTMYVQKFPPGGGNALWSAVVTGAETIGIDNYDNAWAGNYQSGVVSKVSPSGAVTPYTLGLGGSNSGPQCIAGAKDGTVWISMGSGGYSNAELIRVDQSGTVLLPIVPPDPNGGLGTLAIDSHQQIWVMYGSSSEPEGLLVYSSSGALVQNYNLSSLGGAYGGWIGFDLIGNLWALYGNGVGLYINPQTINTGTGVGISKINVTAEVKGTSTTSLTVATGTQTLTTQTGLAFASTRVLLVDSANPSNYMFGTITSYTSGTGVLVASISSVAGSGTYSTWNIQNGIGPYAGAIDGNNNLWVVGKQQPVLQVIGSGGQTSASYTYDSLSNFGSLSASMDSAGNLLVANEGGTSLFTIQTNATGIITPIQAQIRAVSGSGVQSVTFTGDGIVDSATPSTAVTSSGTVAATPLTQSANEVLAGPTTGSAAAPTFRSLAVGDLPTGTSSSSIPIGGVITAGGPTGSSTSIPVITYNAAGQLTAVTTATPTVSTVQGGAANQILYQTAANTTGFISAAANCILFTNASSVPSCGTSIPGFQANGNVYVQASTPATSSNNYSSPYFELRGNYWNGSASAVDFCALQNVLGTGANPASVLTMLCSGSSGGHSINFPYPFSASSLKDTGAAGAGTYCLQIDNTGLISNTGGACGSGSGAVNSVTNSDGTLNISPTTGAVVASLNSRYSKSSCTEAWGGSGTSHALTSGDDAVSNNTCYNDSGVTWTITSVKCRSDSSSNTTTVNPTFGSAGTGTTILSGAITCGNSYAYSSSGTVSYAAWTTGTGINPAMGGSLTGTSIAMIVEYTF